MRSKRYIALLLAAVYLLAVGGPSAVALACRCMMPERLARHVCCEHCNHEVVETRTVMHESCCGNHHSTDIVLYVASSHDSEKFVKRVACSDLPDALAPEPLVAAGGTLLPVGCDRIAMRCAGSMPDSFLASCGLRAPPVLV